MNPETGQTIANYRLERELGRGGMATVYLGQDLKHGRQVAVKVMSPELSQAIGRDRFLREIQVAARLTHPHIVPLHDSGEADGLLYYVMPLISGESLRERLRRERQLPIADAVRIAREVSDALDYAHGQGLIHRDVKPENILLSGGHALICDFGIARSSGGGTTDSMTQTISVAGTPTYMSPEQVNGAGLDGRSDQYSLACAVYEMLAGQPPFTGPSADSIALQHRTVEPRPVGALRPTVPQPIVQALSRALAKAPADRFSSVSAFAEALASVPTPAGGRGPTPTPSGLPGGRVMLAVLPLDNLSADPEQEFFTDGMTEELIAHLGRLQPKRLGVIARTSAMRYKKTQKSIEEIGRELGVDHVLEGSIRRAGDRVRITVQLIQVADQTHLWAENYDRRMADVFDLQSEVASSVAKTLELELLPAEKAQGSAAPAATSVAYEWYLKGRFHWNRRSKESLEKAIEFFERAILEDPVYARAYCGLADAYAVLPIWAHVPALEAHGKAERYARQALDLEPNLAEAHASLAAVLSNKYDDFAGAEKELRRALELDPNYVTAVYWLGTSLQAQGRFDEALAYFERSRKLDPLSVIVYVNFATLYIVWRKYDEAMQYCKQVLDLDPTWPRAYSDYALVHAFRGEYERALSILEEARARGIWGLNEITIRGYTLGRMGREADARAELRNLEERGRTSPVSPNFSAAVLAGLKESSEAVRVMSGAIKSREVSPPMLRWHPIWDPIRDTPEFQALLARAQGDVTRVEQQRGA